jgi:hypothetical protein
MAFAAIAVSGMGDVYHQPGMALRDWFAGMALMGANANPDLLQVVTSGSILDGSMSERMAARMYQQADAMLKARQQSGGSDA